MKLIVGLGNPGSRYAGTRHNVGFVVIDSLARGVSFARRFECELAEVMEGDQKVLLAKPQTFMNLSGRAVRQIIDFYQLEADDLFVICDDINLPLGQLRARARGTHGGHNGLRDIQNHLGTTAYARLRIGVGAPDGADPAEYVLDRFRPAEKSIVLDSCIRAAQAAGVWMIRGITACMNQYNVKAGD